MKRWKIFSLVCIEYTSLIKSGDRVQRRDVWGKNKDQPIGPVLLVVSVEDQIGQYGNVVKTGGIIRLEDGSVELPGNLIPIQINGPREDEIDWDAPIDLGKQKKFPSMLEIVLEEIMNHD